MFAATLNRFAISLSSISRACAAKTFPQKGPLPTWINDPQLSEQLLKDTGLAPDDLGIARSYDDKKPFFMQQNYW